MDHDWKLLSRSQAYQDVYICSNCCRMCCCDIGLLPDPKVRFTKGNGSYDVWYDCGELVAMDVGSS